MGTQDDINREYAKKQAQEASDAAKKRVTEEAEDLKGKIDRLHGFIQSPKYYEVNDTQKGLLKSQLNHMQSYWQILLARLKAW